jgi:hypothetical protein
MGDDSLSMGDHPFSIGDHRSSLSEVTDAAIFAGIDGDRWVT